MRREEDRPRTATPPAVHARARPATASSSRAPARAQHLEAEARALEMAEHIAWKRGIDRRRFLQGAGGIAVTLAAINLAGCDDGDKKTLPPGVTAGATYDVPDRRRSGRRLREARGRRVHLRCADAPRRSDGAVGEGEPGHRAVLPRASSAAIRRAREADQLDCLSRYYYAHDIFLESDTTHRRALRHAVRPTTQDPLNFDEMKRTRDIINQLSPNDIGRMRLHSVVVPNVTAGVQQRSSTACRRAPKRWTSRRGRSTRRTGRTGRAGSSTIPSSASR